MGMMFGLAKKLEAQPAQLIERFATQLRAWAARRVVALGG
jgi:hypothetical protein